MVLLLDAGSDNSEQHVLATFTYLLQQLDWHRCNFSIHSFSKDQVGCLGNVHADQPKMSSVSQSGWTLISTKRFG